MTRPSENWQHLAEQASHEMDLEKLRETIKKLTRALAECEEKSREERNDQNSALRSDAHTP
jgi:hypothetical protein